MTLSRRSSELIDLWKAKEVDALGDLAPKPAAEVEAQLETAGTEEPTIEESELEVTWLQWLHSSCSITLPRSVSLADMTSKPVRLIEFRLD